MANFPKLKTGAVMQYPASKVIQFQNQTVRFLDGTEQRYRDSASPLHRWVIHLTGLDEREMAAFEQFFLDNQGRLASFPFTDPWDATTYPSCSLASDDLELGSVAEMRGRTSLTVIENRT